MSSDEFGQYRERMRNGPVVVGYNGRSHAREALVWAAEEASRREVPLVVMNAANCPGMALGPGPGLLDPSPRGLEVDEEVTAATSNPAVAAASMSVSAGAVAKVTPDTWRRG